MNAIKRFFKEIKRVRWPKGKDATKTFWNTILFIVITSLVLFGLSVGLMAMWNEWGVGING